MFKECDMLVATEDLPHLKIETDDVAEVVKAPSNDKGNYTLRCNKRVIYLPVALCEGAFELQKEEIIKDVQVDSEWEDVATRPRRVAAMHITADFLPLLFNKDMVYRVKDNGLPEGVVAVGVTQDPYSNLIVVWLEHESFEEVPPGEEAPLLPHVEFERMRYPEVEEAPDA